MKKKLKFNSIIIKIGLLMLVVVIVQALFFTSVISFTGVSQALESFSYDLFAKTVQNRKNFLETTMVDSWSNIYDYSDAVSEIYIETIGDDKNPDDEKIIEFLNSSVNPIIDMIIQTTSTGGFIILNDSQGEGTSNSTIYFKSDNYATICI